MAEPPPTAPSPSSTSIAIATAILSLALGYFLGSASSIGLFSSPSSTRKSTSKAPAKSWPNSYDVTIHPDSSDEVLMKSLGRGKEVKDSEEEDSSDEDSRRVKKGDLETFEGNKEECKLVLVVRTDLGMGKGKIAAQASHATLACYTTLLYASSPILKRWASLGQAKIAVQASSEDELLVLQAKAVSLGLCARVIHDAGRTQIASGTATVLGVGPGPKSFVDQVTGGLKLL